MPGGAACPRRTVPGFTLVEILVVLVILAVAGGVAALALAPDERGMTLRESRRFAGALEYAAARAQSRGETLGVSASAGSVRFWRRDSQEARWQPVDDDVLAVHALPSPLAAAAVAYAGRRIPADAVVPLKPSGRNEPFMFVVTSPAWRVAVVADPLNRVSLDGPVPAAP
ncbi:MAG: GspH/FimT family pseudopilin [Casimicrobiaceae bacterium]